jgi:hypothetical protein
MIENFAYEQLNITNRLKWQGARSSFAYDQSLLRQNYLKETASGDFDLNCSVSDNTFFIISIDFEF